MEGENEDEGEVESVLTCMPLTIVTPSAFCNKPLAAAGGWALNQVKHRQAMASGPRETMKHTRFVYQFRAGAAWLATGLAMFTLSARATTSPSPSPPPGLAFKVEGEIDYEVVQPGHQQRWTRRFVAMVDGCDWHIASWDASTRQQALKVYQDGVIRNLVAVTRTNGAMNDYAMLVESNDVPSSDTAGISAIWLAYGSSCYLHSVTNDQFKPIWLLDDPALRDENHTVRGVLTRLETGLPKQLVYFNEGVIYGRSPTGNRSVIRAPVGFAGPVTNALFRVTETTTVGKCQLPKAFEFIRYGVRPDFTTYRLAKITGKINAATLTEAGQSRSEWPEVRGTIYVEDRRFERSGAGELRYSVTNLTFLKNQVPR